MLDTPWLTVVIPVYMAERTIIRTIESVASQRMPGVEVICVSDASPDNSMSLVHERFQTSPAVVLARNSENLGPGATRNHGIDIAKGEYIVFLDSDDMLSTGALTTLKQVLSESKPDLVLVGCEEERRGRIKSLTDGPLWESLLIREAPISVTEDPRVLFWPPAPWSKVYLREFLIENSLRFGEGVAQDIPWSAAVTLQAQKIAVCPGVFYRYVTADKDSSITTTTSEKNLGRLSQVRAIRENNDLSAFPLEVARHVAALAEIHLIWSNRAAYRLFPEGTHEQFFSDSAAELRAWDDITTVPASVDCDPLMSARDRTIYAKAIRRGSWENWQRTLRRQKTLSRLRRMFRPGRVFGSG